MQKLQETRPSAFTFMAMGLQFMWGPVPLPRLLIAIHVLGIQENVHWMEVKDLDARQSNQSTHAKFLVWAIKTGYVILPEIRNACNAGPQLPWLEFNTRLGRYERIALMGQTFPTEKVEQVGALSCRVTSHAFCFGHDG
jgi:hypothetical protein